ncbi:MAG: hypothetical protein K1Y01_05950 [Vicinamibacteria bacterium]|nr:hypothetical protein [Vicinamibacteria bacterium]
MRIKGTSISSFLAFLEAEYGSARLKEFIATLEPDLKKRCEGLVLASAFYPVEELESLARKARQHFAGDETFYERSGAHNAFFGLNGVHKALIARPTPLDFLRAAERAWGQFMDEGAVDANLVGDGKVRVRYEAIRGSDVRCARATGFLKRSLQLVNAQGLVVTKTACTEKGHPFCEWNVVWDAILSPPSMTHTSAIRRPIAI